MADPTAGVADSTAVVDILGAAALRADGNKMRILKHLCMPSWWSKRAFPAGTMQKIETAIRQGESRHYGEICFVIEASLHLYPLLRGVTARDRAIELFSQLRVWDTEHNSGILIYLLLADRNVEIIADRGITRPVGNATWENI